MIDRIKELIQISGLSIRGFALKCGMNQPTLDRMLKGINALNLSCVTSILIAYPDVSAEWLLRGIGSMFIADVNSKEIERTSMLVDTIATLQQALNEKSKTIELLQERINQLESK